eukprot:gene10269-12596_t
MKQDELLLELIAMDIDPVVAQLALEQTNYQGLQQAIDFIFNLDAPASAQQQKPTTPPSTSTPSNTNTTPTTTASSTTTTPPSKPMGSTTSPNPTPNKKLKTSIRESAESVDSDEEYYQDVDDYEFNTPIVDASGATNTVVQSDDLIKSALTEIQKITEVTETSPYAATLMLLHFKWNSNRLLERYYEDPDKVKQQSGVPKVEKSTVLADVNGQDCMICGDELNSKNGCYLSCNHYACTGCWAQYLTIKIKEGESIGITCTGYKCPIVVPDYFISRVVPEMYSKYLERLAQTFVDKNPNMRWCPAPGCGNALKADSALETVAQCSCGYRICFKCNQEAHVPANCDQIKLWKKKCEDDSETANWITANTQDCPKCHSAIEKNGGCNHMTCKKCKYEFCWICMGDWKNHKQCNSYSKEQNNNKSDSKKQLERYLFYFHRYNTHEQSKKFETKLRKAALDTIQAFQNKKDKRWIDVKFIEQSSETLIMCRRTLKYTYVFAYYLDDGPEKNLFEYLQSDLEKTTEQLSFFLEKGEDQNVFNLKEITNLASTKLNHLVEGVEEGLTIGR